MYDPLGFLRPRALEAAFQPVAEILCLPHLSYHIHELLFSLLIYQLIYTIISPFLSNILFPKFYNHLKGKDKIDWNIHVVSLTQSIVNSLLSLFILLYDEERRSMTWQKRVWGYTSATNMLLALANGYFIFHFLMMVIYRKTYGWGMVIHGISVLAIMLPGLRPAFNYYAPAGMIFELSNIFLNIHRFTVKLSMDGSLAQLINGIFLIISFFFVRLVFGTYTAASLFRDLYLATTEITVSTIIEVPCSDDGIVCTLQGPFDLPIWIAVVHVIANVALWLLNWYWFGKMTALLRRRISRGLGKNIEKKEN